MNTRPLTKGESVKLSQLNEAGLDSALLFLTETGLKKSILDATHPVRELLSGAGVHDYASQSQGPEHKVELAARVFCGEQVNETKVSLYRPKTKKGDPRIWPGRLSSVANANDVLAVFYANDSLCFLNLSDQSFVGLTDDTPLTRFLETTTASYNSVSDELLFKLRQLAESGPLKAVGTGSTAIGRTIETYLGIEINSSQKPDYKGIEIKSKRSAAKVRSTLFAKVADWDLSHFKSSREIVEEIGYDADPNCKKLYCSVSTLKPNSQGLVFDLDLDAGRLNELLRKADQQSPVAVWRLDGLHNKLYEKHNETFWVEAKESDIDGTPHFELKSAKHTRRPSGFHFDRLLGAGDITMDHLIKRTEVKTTEKGPLFKIKPDAIDELFLGRSTLNVF